MGKIRIFIKIIWSPKALQSYFIILNFLNEKWSQKQVENFVNQTEKVIEQLAENPNMFIATNKRKNVRKGFVNITLSAYFTRFPYEKKKSNF